MALLVAEKLAPEQLLKEKPGVNVGVPQPTVAGSHLRPTRKRWIVIVDAHTYKQLYKITGLGTLEDHFYFSPKGSFFVTCQPQSLPTEQNPDKYTLKVYSMADGKIIQKFVQSSKQCWPVMRWADNELTAFRFHQGQIFVYDYKQATSRPSSQKPLGPSQTSINDLSVEESEDIKDIFSETLSCNGIQDFEIARSSVAVYIPGQNGLASQIAIYSIAQNAETDKSKPYPQISSAKPTASKHFFRSDEVKMYWHNRGQSLLSVISTHMKKEGKSYYGDTFLKYLSADGKLSMDVDLDQDGPIYSVQWNLKGNDFAVTYGHMPAKTGLFNRKCKLLGTLGMDSRNTLQWSPHGRVLTVSGYKDLTGEVDFWDTVKLKKLGSAVSYCSGYEEFSPDGRLYLSAVLWPRMKVDNCISIFDLGGNRVFHYKKEEIWKARFRPNPNCPSCYPPVDQDFVLKKAAPVPVEKKTGGGVYKHPNWSNRSKPLVGKV